MVSPPAVFVAGMLRAGGQGLETDAWSWICQQASQLLFDPPYVSGWDYADRLDTARWAGRLEAVDYVIEKSQLDASADTKYPTTETPQHALSSALDFWGDPALSTVTTAHLTDYGRRVQADMISQWEQQTYRVLRQNALRALILMTPDWQTS